MQNGTDCELVVVEQPVMIVVNAKKCLMPEACRGSSIILLLYTVQITVLIVSPTSALVQSNIIACASTECKPHKQINDLN